MSAKTVYATINGARIGGTQDGDRVLVHVVNGGVVGWYRLSRFEGEKLTPKTLRQALEGKPHGD